MKRRYTPKVQESIVPIPPELVGLPTIEAEPWFQVDSSTDAFLEGPVFDREGNLFVTSPPFGIVYKITLEERRAKCPHNCFR